LAAIDGLDFQQGLGALRGNMNAYLRLLHQFIQGHGDDPTRINEYRAAGQNDDARRLAHTVKGTAGTLGLVKLQGAAAKLELQLKMNGQEDEWIEALSGFTATLNGVRLAMAGLPDGQVAAASVPVMDKQQLKSLLNQLRPLMAIGDVAAGTLMDESGQALIAALGKPAKTLQQQVDGFDFPAAVQTLEEIMAGLD
jgi:HPt (histidine-containing phosphotransfer) domain-containing protein